MKRMPPPPPPPLPGLGPASFPGLEPSNRRQKVVPAPPPLPPGYPKTTQEFLEKIKKFPKVQHDHLDPQACFDIAAALVSSNSRGAKLFAKRKARVSKFEMESQGQAEDTETESPAQMYYPTQQLTSKLATHSDIEPREMLVASPPISRFTSNATTVEFNSANSSSYSPALVEPSSTSWKPVKFRIPGEKI
ncbi:hypothetical protein Ciccas_013328 [Cichlidogyrus casuarinus]|uniref:Uncharacterized protein n=1 Tax=Cichlidogyrus casuarinus TaxID=1844966 RepID=A0ABD2PL04_9PLAT